MALLGDTIIFTLISDFTTFVSISLPLGVSNNAFVTRFIDAVALLVKWKFPSLSNVTAIFPLRETIFSPSVSIYLMGLFAV